MESQGSLKVQEESIRGRKAQRDAPLLALKMAEGGHGPGNAGSL